MALTAAQEYALRHLAVSDLTTRACWRLGIHGQTVNALFRRNLVVVTGPAPGPLRGNCRIALSERGARLLNERRP